MPISYAEILQAETNLLQRLGDAMETIKKLQDELAELKSKKSRKAKNAKPTAAGPSSLDR